MRGDEPLNFSASRAREFRFTARKRIILLLRGVYIPVLVSTFLYHRPYCTMPGIVSFCKVYLLLRKLLVYILLRSNCT